MTILHCIPKKDWDSMKEQEQFGQPMLDASGFIHCSMVKGPVGMARAAIATTSVPSKASTVRSVPSGPAAFFHCGTVSLSHTCHQPFELPSCAGIDQPEVEINIPSTGLSKS